jgi:hypothetical protein
VNSEKNDRRDGSGCTLKKKPAQNKFMDHESTCQHGLLTCTAVVQMKKPEAAQAT